MGNFHLVYDGKTVPGFDSQRLQSFLAYLLLHRDAPLSRQRLSFLFWPDSRESQARTNLRNLIHKVRTAFPELDSYLEVEGQTLHWNHDLPLDLDLDHFQAAVDHADLTGGGKDQAGHLVALSSVSDTYPGDLLPSCYTDWIIPYREEYQQKFLRVIEELVALLESAQDYDGAIQQAQKWVRIDPLSELAYQNLMLIYFLKGEKARAIRTYHQCVEILEREMGMDPGADLQRLYQRVMEREITSPAPPRVSEKKSRLIGRDQAWNQLQEAWLAHESGCHLVAVMGEAGIGKTALANELVRWAKNGRITCLNTRSYSTEDELAYTPVAGLLREEDVLNRLEHLEDAWLSELARLLPELRSRFPDLTDPDRLSDSWKRRRLFEASTRALTVNKGRLIIFLDDLQWCDRETLDWLRFLLAYQTNTKILIITGVRTEDLLAESPLIPFFAELGEQDQITEILLERLDPEETARMAADLWGDALDQRAALRLYQETEGNPLFVAEMVRGGFIQSFEAASDYKSMPPRVQAVIESRLNALNPRTRELAGLAAVVGRGFDYELLMQTGEQDEDAILQGLDELWSRRLIRDEGAKGYDFNHEKFREVLYGEISPHRRVHYHKEVAVALEKIHIDQLELVAPRLAYQYKEAGEMDKALDYYLIAGDQARLVFAQEEALNFFKAGEELHKTKKDPRAIRLYSGIGNTLFKLACYDEAADAFIQAGEIARSIGDHEKEAEAYLSAASTKDRLGKFDAAIELADIAAEISRKENCEKEYANALLMKGQQYYRMGKVDDAEPLLLEALKLHQELKNHSEIGRCLNVLGLVQDIKGKFKEASDYKERAISIFKEIANNQSQWEIGNLTLNLAITANLKGDYQEALNLYFDAEEYMKDFVDRDWRTMWLFNVGASYVNLKIYDKAEEYLGDVLERTEGSGWLGLSLTYFYLAECYLGQGQMKYAEKSALEALSLAEESGGQEYLGAAWRVLGKIAGSKKGELKIDRKDIHAEDCFAASKDYFQKANAKGEIAHTLKAWAEYELNAGDKKKGASYWKEARELFLDLDMSAEVERMDIAAT